MKYYLTGSDWKLIYAKNEDYLKDGAPTVLSVLKEHYPEIDAVVPGNLEIDLQRSGVIDDPFYGKNFFDRSCEYLHMFYTKEFEFAGDMKRPVLVFEGIDTCADIYLNGFFVGYSENMLIPHEIEVAGVIKPGKNTLTVHIKPAVIEARKYPLALNENALKYNYESLYIRKAPHMYGWDIFPRIVSGGIFRPVYIEERNADRISEFYGYTAAINSNGARLYFAYNTEIESDDITRYSVKLEGVCGDSRFSATSKLYHTGGRLSFTVKEPKLWWPRNAGEQNLYDVTFTLYKDGEIADVHTTRLGIRTVELDRTSTTNEKGEGEFRFIVNGKPVFCMGTNWVPIDSLHSRDAERLPHILPMLTDIGCNIIRIWGGGVYEDEQLYKYCDEQGIMVWQDFIMGCAVYPQDEDFQRKIRDEATVIVKKLRMHPSIILWAGDNEDDFVYYYQWGGAIRRDPNTNLLTRKVLPEVLRMHDYVRPYLPSSPYVDEEAYKTGASISEDHLWGPRDYFKGGYYKNNVSHFASETGYHGC
ncbi:MAG: glycoside hydrolase family 2, partial [Clostridia bacterium]|nr:glycoside hydrolase family 2 [Clostridia bacterium]